MPRFLFWGDLHTEIAPFDIPGAVFDVLGDPLGDPLGGIDAILVAGDTSAKKRHVAALGEIARKTGLPVIAIRGNHEGYATNLASLERQEARDLIEMRREGLDVRILENASTLIAGVRVIGATLWTDCAIEGDDPVSVLDTMLRIQSGMNDHRRIRTGWSDYGRLTPLHTSRMHAVSRAFIARALTEAHDAGETAVVMTHHLPHPDLTPRKYAGHPLRGAYASRLSDGVLSLDYAAWIYAHVHDAGETGIDTSRGPRRFVSNSRGYPGENTGFDAARVLDIET